MDGKRWAALKTIFGELLDLDQEERSERLATLAARDPELSAQLARLLAADASADRRLRPLESPLSPAMTADGGDALPVEGTDATDALRDPFGLSGRTVSHFRVQQVLGAGGMGVVYRAEDLRLGRTVALKFLLPQYSRDASAKERFLLEARTASALDHPHICTIYEAGGSEQGQLFLAMSCYAGETLSARLSREGALPVEEAVELARQICSALGAAHAAGIVHRDLKPGNLMLTPEGMLKILDFGLAKVRELNLTGSGVRPGTVAYMSPEQLQSEEVDARSDLWSLGVVLYEMLTGVKPLGAGHELSTIFRILFEEPAAPSSLRPEIPAELEQVVLRLLSKEPERRFSSVAEVTEALTRTGRGLPVEAPAARSRIGRPGSRAAIPHYLLAQPTSLVGREEQIHEIRARLQRSEVGLLTLTGAGGIGKTRLALQAAAELVEHFRDGVFFVNLAPVRDPLLLPSTIAQTLDLREGGTHSPVEMLSEYLRDKQLLLLLDNFEQIVEAAPTVVELLAAAPGLKILATSRTRLQVQSEQEYQVPPLSLPELADLPPLTDLARNETVRLFCERAQAARADFRLTQENARAIAEIGHRLDGLPLAIELAAARIKILSPQALLARLRNRLKLLTGGAKDGPERHQTLRDALAWSYDLLSEGERVLFRRLSVFAGGRTLEAIEAVCQAEGDPELDALDGVSSLLDKSLLQQEETDGEPRFVMLETIHEYAREKLEESGEADRLRRRHAEHFLALAEEAEPQLAGSEQGRWFSRLRVEHDNCRTALRVFLENGESESAARLAGTLWRFWNRHGHFREGRRWLVEVLASADLSPPTRAKALLGAGILANFQNDAAAQPLLEESLALARAVGDRRMVAPALQGLGHAARIRGELAGATALFEQALALHRELGDRRSESVVLGNLGSLAHVQGDYERAETLSAECLAIARQVGDTMLTAFALHTLGRVACDQGDPGRAGALLRESLLCSREAGDLRLLVFDLAHLAVVAGALGASERAARLAGVAEARFAALGTHMNPAGRADYDRHLAAIRARLDESSWQRAWQEGSALTLEEAVAYALEEDVPTAPGNGVAGPEGAAGRTRPTAPPAAPAPSRRRISLPRQGQLLTLGGVLVAGALAALAAGEQGQRVLGALGIGAGETLLNRGVLAAREPILLADFTSPTGDSLVAGLATVAFRIDLAQSPILTLVEPQQVREALGRMEMPDITLLDLELAREVAVREGVKAVLGGEIARSGSGYLLSARLLAAESGKTLASERETAADSTALIAAIDRLSSRLRERIGESLRSIQDKPPLAWATTSSLEALRKYSQALHAIDVQGDEIRGLALLEEAIALDSAFAMAYVSLAVTLRNRATTDERARMVEALTRAYRHRDRLTDRERYAMLARYYSLVTGEWEQSITASRMLLASYPNDRDALNNLASLYFQMRDWARAEEYGLRAWQADSTTFLALLRQMMAQFYQGKFEEAEGTLQRFGVRFPENWRNAHYSVLIAAAQGDYLRAERLAQAERQARPADGAVQANMVGRLSELAFVQGRLNEAERYTREGAELFRQQGRPGSRHTAALAYGRMEFTIRGASAMQRIRRMLAEYPLSEAPVADRPYLMLAALHARAGQPQRARALLAEWESLVPADVRRLDEPERDIVLGEIAAAEGRPLDAIHAYRRSEPEYRLGNMSVPSQFPPLLGRAFEQAGQADSAIVHYERFLGTPDLLRILTDAEWRGFILERLGQLYEARGDAAKAAEYYTRFIELWEDADPDLQPRVREARLRMAALTPAPPAAR